MYILPLPCKLLVDKTPSVEFNSFASEIKTVDTQVESSKVNTSPRSYTLSWKTLSIAEKDVVEAFLKQVGTWYSFIINESSSNTEQISVSCLDAYSLSNSNGFFNIDTTVMEVF